MTFLEEVMSEEDTDMDKENTKPDNAERSDERRERAVDRTFWQWRKPTKALISREKAAAMF